MDGWTDRGTHFSDGKKDVCLDRMCQHNGDCLTCCEMTGIS